MAFQVEQETVGPALVVRVRGRFAGEAGEAVGRLMSARPGPCVLNLAGVEYISSAGVAALVKLSTRHGLRIASPADCVRDVLSLAGVERVLAIHPDEREACGS